MIIARLAPWLAGAAAIAAIIAGFWWLIDRNAELRRDADALRNQIEKREAIQDAIDDVRGLDPAGVLDWLRDRASQ